MKIITKEELRKKGKYILDACCGGRTFWFNKNHPNTIYIDIKPRPKGIVKERPNWSCEPDIIADFRNLPFKDQSFKHIVWDPPHLDNCGESGFMFKKYGSLDKDNWREDLTKGFNELWRVLEDYGNFVFKWNETRISIKEVLKLFSQTPLYGHPTAKNGKTKWFSFVKIPELK